MHMRVFVYVCVCVCVYELSRACASYICVCVRVSFSSGMKSWQIVFVTKCVWASEEVDFMMIAYNRVVIELSDNSRKPLCNGQ